MKIDLIPVESNMMTAIGYDALSQTLAIAWKPKKNNLRTVEHYPNVDAALWESFSNAESKGKFWLAELKQLPHHKDSEIE